MFFKPTPSFNLWFDFLQYRLGNSLHFPYYLCFPIFKTSPLMTLTFTQAFRDPAQSPCTILHSFAADAAFYAIPCLLCQLPGLRTDVSLTSAAFPLGQWLDHDAVAQDSRIVLDQHPHMIINRPPSAEALSSTVTASPMKLAYARCVDTYDSIH